MAVTGAGAAVTPAPPIVAPMAQTVRSPPGMPAQHRRPAVLDASRAALIPLRPLTISEILDGGFLVVRRNARLMVGLPLVIAGGTAVYALIGVGLWFLLGNTTAQWVQIALLVIMGLVGFLLLVQCLVWMTAILSRVTLQTVLGDGFAPATPDVDLRSSLHLFWPVLGLSALQYVAASIIQTTSTTLFYLVLGASALTGTDDLSGPVVVALSILTSALTVAGYGYISLTVPALATESRRAPDWIGKPARSTTVLTAFERSFRLVGLRNLFRVTVVLAAATLVSVALVALLAGGALAVVLLFATSINLDVRTVLTNPWTLSGVFAFALVVAMSGLLAYVAAVQTLLYLDLRMRREGLDLALRFDCVPVPQPVAPPPVYQPYPSMAFPPPAAFRPPGPRPERR